MRQIIILGLFNLIIFNSLSQVNLIEKWPQFEIETNNMDVSVQEKISTYNLQNNNWGKNDITNSVF